MLWALGVGGLGFRVWGLRVRGLRIGIGIGRFRFRGLFAPAARSVGRHRKKHPSTHPDLGGLRV